jgi:hypothetical protein
MPWRSRSKFAILLAFSFCALFWVLDRTSGFGVDLPDREKESYADFGLLGKKRFESENETTATTEATTFFRRYYASIGCDESLAEGYGECAFPAVVACKKFAYADRLAGSKFECIFDRSRSDFVRPNSAFEGNRYDCSCDVFPLWEFSDRESLADTSDRGKGTNEDRGDETTEENDGDTGGDDVERILIDDFIEGTVALYRDSACTVPYSYGNSRPFSDRERATLALDLAVLEKDCDRFFGIIASVELISNPISTRSEGTDPSSTAPLATATLYDASKRYVNENYETAYEADVSTPCFSKVSWKTRRTGKIGFADAMTIEVRWKAVYVPDSKKIESSSERDGDDVERNSSKPKRPESFTDAFSKSAVVENLKKIRELELLRSRSSTLGKRNAPHDAVEYEYLEKTMTLEISVSCGNHEIWNEESGACEKAGMYKWFQGAEDHDGQWNLVVVLTVFFFVMLGGILFIGLVCCTCADDHAYYHHHDHRHHHHHHHFRDHDHLPHRADHSRDSPRQFLPSDRYVAVGTNLADTPLMLDYWRPERNRPSARAKANVASRKKEETPFGVLNSTTAGADIVQVVRRKKVYNFGAFNDIVTSTEYDHKIYNPLDLPYS